MPEARTDVVWDNQSAAKLLSFQVGTSLKIGELWSIELEFPISCQPFRRASRDIKEAWVIQEHAKLFIIILY